jgi:hypothetical protein
VIFVPADGTRALSQASGGADVHIVAQAQRVLDHKAKVKSKKKVRDPDNSYVAKASCRPGIALLSKAMSGTIICSALVFLSALVLSRCSRLCSCRPLKMFSRSM